MASSQTAVLPPTESRTLFDASWGKLSNVPTEFVWPGSENRLNLPELQVPQIDLKSFLSGDPKIVETLCAEVNEACKKHGFLILVNHGVDAELVATTEKLIDEFFTLPMEEKLRAERVVPSPWGYASSFLGRFHSTLPWKETLSINYCAEPNRKTVEEYFARVLGEDYKRFGTTLEEYGEAMSNVCLVLMELLGLSLGVGRKYFRDFYEDNESVMRLNYYPTCQRPDLALGIGPHCDPTSLTILHQDLVGGLQVFADDQWYSVSPKQGAFVVNIGDTFTAMTNGLYKSCLHRVVVNEKVVRRSIAFFLNPNGKKVVIPPKELVTDENPRLYPDFTWPIFLEFTQKFYRTDSTTLEVFSKWVEEQNQQQCKEN
ncbi:gibberellin 20 oxidase 4-like [Arachis hypogaea]|uniref:Fe2OG dioxygenase domain-containing protein n=1 Tax=Arachis hypogaea TaxID=3818 RepID=A0A444WVW1_ARAHY|nr:gibberellin 20 oxidase 4-like [Arachis hypogaea]XP_025697779.1 gibberellin 20 oxidase 4-like [Arachis hypogaea]QHO44411.1 Gibberellin 20 oxidase [Arachis hypogaea]RYQ81588.1 hypothetical protein Ahy_Scaffold1g107476 [Arachis hypogaea]